MLLFKTHVANSVREVVEIVLASLASRIFRIAVNLPLRGLRGYRTRISILHKNTNFWRKGRAFNLRKNHQCP